MSTFRLFQYVPVVALALTVSGGTPWADSPQPPAGDHGPRAPFPPIPKVQNPVAAPAALQRVYEFVANNEQVIRYVPCFCGCEAKGHQSVESCFIAQRTPDGGVVWSDHGAACGVCYDVADAARQLTAEGTSVTEVRRIIMERFYRQRMTPTPEPPGGEVRHELCPLRHANDRAGI